MSAPMYRLIAEDLRRRIESGELPPGAQLQSEVELREKYGQDAMVSRNTRPRRDQAPGRSRPG